MDKEPTTPEQVTQPAPDPAGSADAAQTEHGTLQTAESREAAVIHRLEVTEVRLNRRWHASVAIVIAMALYVALPVRLTFIPWQAVVAVEVILLIPVLISVTLRGANAEKGQRIIAIILIAVLNTANFISLVLLVDRLLHGKLGNSSSEGYELILSSMNIWITNVIVFALWYWELDRGGPIKRAHQHRHLLATDHGFGQDQKHLGAHGQHADFLFPYMTAPDYAPPDWTPSFIDYVYVSFTNSTAFSPTDTLPLTAPAKMLMMIQSLISLLTVALVAARAVNILR